MVKSLLLFILVLTSNPLIAGQQKSRAANPTVHKPNNVYRSSSFEGVVYPRFQGNDLKQIAAGLAFSYASRSEFETTAQYESRILRAGSVPLPGGIAPDSPLAFVFPTEESLRSDPLGQFILSSTYDADKQTMKVEVEAQPTQPEPRKMPRELAIRWNIRLESSSKYQGTNALEQLPEFPNELKRNTGSQSPLNESCSVRMLLARRVRQSAYLSELAQIKQKL